MGRWGSLLVLYHANEQARVREQKENYTAETRAIRIRMGCVHDYLNNTQERAGCATDCGFTGKPPKIAGMSAHAMVIHAWMTTIGISPSGGDIKTILLVLITEHSSKFTVRVQPQEPAVASA